MALIVEMQDHLAPSGYLKIPNVRGSPDRTLDCQTMLY